MDVYTSYISLFLQVGVNQDIKNHSSWGTTRTKSLTVIVSRMQESAGILTQVSDLP